MTAANTTSSISATDNGFITGTFSPQSLAAVVVKHAVIQFHESDAMLWEHDPSHVTEADQVMRVEALCLPKSVQMALNVFQNTKRSLRMFRCVAGMEASSIGGRRADDQGATRHCQRGRPGHGGQRKSGGGGTGKSGGQPHELVQQMNAARAAQP